MVANAATYRNMERVKSCKITNMIRVKGSETRSFIFIYRMHIVLRDSYQANEFVMEVEEWRHKVPDDYVKSFISRVLLHVLEKRVTDF